MTEHALTVEKSETHAKKDSPMDDHTSSQPKKKHNTIMNIMTDRIKQEHFSCDLSDKLINKNKWRHK